MTETVNGAKLAPVMESAPGRALAGKIATGDLADELLARARADGASLVGPGGLLSDLTKQVLESMLESELTEHVGYKAYDPAGHNSGNSRNGTRPPRRIHRRRRPGGGRNRHDLVAGVLGQDGLVGGIAREHHRSAGFARYRDDNGINRGWCSSGSGGGSQPCRRSGQQLVQRLDFPRPQHAALEIIATMVAGEGLRHDDRRGDGRPLPATSELLEPGPLSARRVVRASPAPPHTECRRAEVPSTLSAQALASARSASLVGPNWFSSSRM